MSKISLVKIRPSHLSFGLFGLILASDVFGGKTIEMRRRWRRRRENNKNEDEEVEWGEIIEMWRWWRENNRNVVTVVVYSFTIHEAGFKKS